MRDNLNYHIPARIVDFQATENKYLTKAKLEVFYIGETVDKRLFTEKFSEELIKTLPQMPVVGYYDEDKEDFIGHNNEQYIYGYVPETTNLEFKERDGKTFAVTDVILFTGRDDNIGDIANRIVGKAQSLEMDPASVTYKINKEDGKFKNIEFTSGHITGMSVLGDDENPAFEGSHFFTEKLEQNPKYAETFVKFIKAAKKLLASETGGVSMNKFLKEFVLNFDVEAFIKKTYDEERAEVHEALANVRTDQWFYIVQMNSKTIVIYDYETGEFSRMDYSRSDDNIEFEDAVRVFPRYLTEEEIDSTFSIQNVEDETETEETEFIAGVENEDEGDTEFTQSSSNEQGEELGVEEETHSEETTDFTESNDSGSTETFTSEERAELNEFRKKEKLIVLDKYSKYLTEEEVATLVENLDSYNATELEKEIKVVAFEAMQKALLEKNTNTQEPVTTFTIGNIAEDVDSSHTNDIYIAMKNLL